MGRNSALDCPSPCSPDREPPWDRTRSVASSRNDRNFWMPFSVCGSQSILVCTHPWPKCPYNAHAYPYLSNSARRSRRYRARFSGGTAESSHPSYVSGWPGTNAVAPSPDSRTSQIFASAFGSSYSFSPVKPGAFRISFRSFKAFASDAFFDSAANSASIHPLPSGSSSSSSRCLPSFLLFSTRTSSNPSSAIGWCSRAAHI